MVRGGGNSSSSSKQEQQVKHIHQIHNDNNNNNNGGRSSVHRHRIHTQGSSRNNEGISEGVGDRSEMHKTTSCDTNNNNQGDQHHDKNNNNYNNNHISSNHSHTNTNNNNSNNSDGGQNKHVSSFSSSSSSLSPTQQKQKKDEQQQQTQQLKDEATVESHQSSSSSSPVPVGKQHVVNSNGWDVVPETTTHDDDAFARIISRSHSYSDDFEDKREGKKRKEKRERKRDKKKGGSSEDNTHDHHRHRHASSAQEGVVVDPSSTNSNDNKDKISHNKSRTAVVEQKESKESHQTEEAPTDPSSANKSSSTTNHPRVNLGRKKLIGKGSFGMVYGAIDYATNAFLAVKEMSIIPGQMTDQQIRAIRKEIKVLKSLDHPNVVRCMGEHWDPTQNLLRIYMEYLAGGSITNILRSFGALKESQASRYTKHMLLGLEYLHSKNIAHRDLKGDNLLVDTNGTLKLADFGTAKEIATAKSSSMAGTAYFMAPEMIKGIGHDVRADIWSAACCVVEMLTGKPPFSQFSNQYATMMHVVELQDGDVPLPDGHTATPACRDFLQRCFRIDPRNRPTPTELLHHRWITLPPTAEEEGVPSVMYHTDIEGDNSALPAEIQALRAQHRAGISGAGSRGSNKRKPPRSRESKKNTKQE